MMNIPCLCNKKTRAGGAGNKDKLKKQTKNPPQCADRISTFSVENNITNRIKSQGYFFPTPQSLHFLHTDFIPPRQEIFTPAPQHQRALFINTD